MTLPPDIVGPALLFCPGNRPERFDRALRAADQAVLDLEDGVGTDDKDIALAKIVALAKRTADRVIVRVNRPLTSRGQRELEALAAAGVRAMVLPKVESGAEVDIAIGKTRSAPNGTKFLITIETAKGVLALEDILSRPHIAAISWGPYDLAADMGLRAVRDSAGDYLSPIAHARDHLLLVAAAMRVPAFDTVTTEMGASRLIARDAAIAADLGFSGKFAIHPAQVPVIRSAFAPPAPEVERSRRMLESAEGRAVYVFEGEMVDEPILRRARHVVALADRLALLAASATPADS